MIQYSTLQGREKSRIVMNVVGVTSLALMTFTMLLGPRTKRVQLNDGGVVIETSAGGNIWNERLRYEVVLPRVSLVDENADGSPDYKMIGEDTTRLDVSAEEMAYFHRTLENLVSERLK